jgi:hypothetical protein
VASLLLAGCTNQQATTASTRPTAYATPAASADESYTRDSVTYLASDYLEGRLPGTRGEVLASEFIANEFRHAGLVPAPGRSDYFQPFLHTTGRRIESASLALANQPLKLDTDFSVLSLSASAAFDAPVVFVGYGVSDPSNTLIPGGYDDYANIDVKDKVVLLMRYEPQSTKEKSRLTENGANTWRASLNAKVGAAADRGAKAVLFVNPPNTHDAKEILPFSAQSGGRPSRLPAAMITAAAADSLLAASGAPTLSALQKQIDDNAKPASLALSSTATGNFKLISERKSIRNVLAVLPGTGPNKSEYIVIGAHYDHLGRGGAGSLLRSSREIHNGADDNASGTTAMLLLAKRMAAYQKQNPNAFDRSILFAAFTAEEQGLIGSQYMVDHPPVPLESMAYMINLDMVGRVKENLLFVGGTGTSELFQPMLDAADAASPLVFRSTGKGGRGPSDHQSFGLKRIPVLFFFSGLHADYHRPTDDAPLINYTGIVQTADIAQSIATQLATAPRTPYIDTYDREGLRLGSSGTFRVTLGIVPDYADEDIKGVKLSGTTPGTPAALAGLTAGDIITHLDDKPTPNLESLTDFLASAKPDQKVKVTYTRAGQSATTTATLAERK